VRKFIGFGDPVVGLEGRTAFIARTSASAGAPALASVWYAPAGAAARKLAGVGEAAPGGGTFAAFTSLVLPDGAASGPAFGALLQAGAGITTANNVGLWVANAEGTLRLLLRTGQKFVVNGRERTVKSFRALTPVSGAAGSARGYDDAQFQVSATFTDQSVAIVALSAAESLP
jgi:hypothetical protein